MIQKHVLLALTIFLGFVTHAAAGDGFYQKLFGGKACWLNCVGAYTCDDYIPKCAPCPPPLGCFTCDDYCRKCLPMPKPPHCFTCDDYCRKPFTFSCPSPPYLEVRPTQQKTDAPSQAITTQPLLKSN